LGFLYERFSSLVRTIVLASEAAQQPHHPYYFDGSVPGVPALSIPTTNAARVAIPPPIATLNFDFGIGQFADKIYGSGPDAMCHTASDDSQVVEGHWGN
jgi:hypothetical protein